MENNNGDDDQVFCLDTLPRNGGIRWGTREKVKYVSRQVKETSLNDEDESRSKGKERANQSMSETQVDEKMVEVMQLRGGSKRMRGGSSGSNERTPKKTITCRWSHERVKSAKEALLGVMKEMDATWHKPVLRQDLREKARKHIGDTGLLDHLLKHMAGEVFSDGKERLIRRHNTQDANEYWLEPAEMVQIRQDAGISDTYWIPPAGWKPGDAINMKSHEENYQRLLMQHGKLQEEVTAMSIAFLSMKEDLRLLKEEKRKKEQVKSEAGCSGNKHSMKEKEKWEKVAAGDEVGRTDNKTVRKSAFRTFKRGSPFLWPNMASAGGTSAYSASPAMPLPPQLVLLGPTPPHPSLCPAFFSQAQSQAEFVQSLSQGQLVHRPTARYPHTARPILRDKDRLDELADPRLRGNYPKDDFLRVCTIAAACVALEANQRPTMGEVVQSLKMVQRTSAEYQDSVANPSSARPISNNNNTNINSNNRTVNYESDCTSSMFSSGPFSGLSF